MLKSNFTISVNYRNVKSVQIIVKAYFKVYFFIFSLLKWKIIYKIKCIRLGAQKLRYQAMYICTCKEKNLLVIVKTEY